MALLTRDAVLGAQDVATKDVAVPEWGGDIRVRSMTVAERNEFSRRTASEESSTTAAWLVSILSVDEAGKELFTPEDVKALEKRNFKAIERVVTAILAVNGIGEKAIEAAGKN